MASQGNKSNLKMPSKIKYDAQLSVTEAIEELELEEEGGAKAE